MSYQVLARKWRPAKFEQMVGQSHVLLALTNALSQQRLHHAYLFTGTRGVGKTSLARLFAKGLNCEQGVTATPCGECSSCVEIAQGRFVDLIEVDAASRTKVDDTRELLDNVQYRPSRGRYKVYLIDEVHMLSRSSFNALLKTLEEPPEHVKFLLATTDPHKLPVTVLSRCLQFNLKSLSQQQISQQLDYVLTQEQLPFEEQALNLLAKAANGSMRDALSLTDQAIAFSSGQVSLQQVQTMLGSIDEHHVIALLNALCYADVAPLMEHIEKVLSFGADADEVLRSLLELLHQITLTQFAPAAAQQSLYSDKILAFAKDISPEQIQLYYQLLLSGRKDLAFAPDPKSGLEMALLRAVAFVPEKPTQRWVVDTPAQVDFAGASLDVASVSEVTETSPKPVPLTESEPNQVEAIATLTTAASTTAPLTTAAPLKATAAETASDDSDLAQDADASLTAEQAVLLSQAQSMGFEAQPNLTSQLTQVKPEDTQGDEQVAENKVTNSAANATIRPETIAASDTSVGANEAAITKESALADSTKLTTSSQVKQNPEFNSEPQPELTEQANAETQVLTESTQAAASMAEDDFYMAMSEQASAQDDYEPYLDEPLPMAPSMMTPNAEAASVVKSLTERTSETATQHIGKDVAPVSENTELDDDILDAVFASNELLMADIDSHHASEDAQKQAASSKPLEVKKPIAKPEVVTLTSQGTASEAPASEPTSEVSVQQVQPTAVSNPSSDADRPPWEPAPANQSVSSEALSNEAKSHESLLSAPSADELSSDDNTASVNASELANAPELTNTPELTRQASQVSAQSEPLQATESDSKPSTQLTTQSQGLVAVGHKIEGQEQDLQWFRVMSQIKVGGRVRQLGVNSVSHNLSSPLKLTLKPDQKHLSAQVAIDQLNQALSEYFDEPTQVEIEIGNVSGRETPLELRKRFHQELTTQATQSLLNDNNVQWMINTLAADLDQDSVLYPSRQLAQIASQIPDLKKI